MGIESFNPEEQHNAVEQGTVSNETFVENHRAFLEASLEVGAQLRELGLPESTMIELLKMTEDTSGPIVKSAMARGAEILAKQASPESTNE